MRELRPKILAIDDTPANLIALGAVLEKDFELQFATSGLAGIALALTSPPDLILLDVMMPEMDGFETCRQLRAQSGLKNIPVIFVTALAEIEAQTRGLELGAADYITKPINIEIARQRIRNLLEREQLRRAVEVQRDQLQAEIAERKLHQQRIDQLLAEQIAILNSQISGILKLKNRKFVWLNTACAEMLGYAKSELIDQPTRIIYSSDEAYAAFAAAYPVVQKGEMFRGEAQFRRKDGSLGDYDISGELLYPGSDESIWSFVDITERKLAENRLAQSESHLRTIVENEPECIKVIDAQGLLIQMNPAGLAMIEADSLAQVAGNPVLGLVAPGHRDAFAAMHARDRRRTHANGI